MTDTQYRDRIPGDFAAKLEAARTDRAMQGERRIVSVLFCDVTGSTEMAEQLDPEEWAEIMNQAFDYLTAPVYRYEGIVARLMGDAILAFFGAPITHEDDPERAVLAGLDIIESIRPFRRQLKRQHGLDFNVRIGINTGAVVVGEIGSDLRMEYTAMGDAVNLAARMEQTALPGTVQITEYTYRLVASLFDVYALGGIAVKGKREPAPAYRVLGWHEHPGRQRGSHALRAPLVGRAFEFDALKRAVDAVCAGRGQIVFLIGDTGLGKSRLIDELRAYWREVTGLLESPGDAAGARRGRPVWGMHHGVSYDASRAYGVFQHYLRRTFEIEEGDPPDVAREKVTRVTRGLPQDQFARVMRAVELLLAAADESAVPPRVGEALKRDLFESMLTGWRSVATYAPCLVAFDDLHWADPASVDVLMHLLQLVEEVPVLFLCATRPDRQSPGWRVREIAAARHADRYTEVVLRPLGEADSQALIDGLLAIPDLPESLRHLILRKTEGNPFFVEEVVQALIDGGAIVRDASGVRWRAEAGVDAARIEIPDSVQALLVARIDRLVEGARHTLQMASVIGRTFSYRVLQHMAVDAPHLDAHLDALQRADLIREVARGSEAAYTFRHELTRDAAYASILRRQRREFHHRVAEGIEALFAERLGPQADRLAYHFDQAGDDARALRYYTLAGDVAAQLYANVEAVSHYTRALEIAGRGVASNAQLIHVYARRGRALEVSGRYTDATANYRDLEALARERGDRALELAALIPQATIHSTYTAGFDPAQGRALSERALALARALKDYRAEAKALWNLMLLTLFARYDARQAVAYGEDALALARRHNLREELAYILHDLARAYFEAGQAGPAWVAQEEALALWRELGDLPMLADALTSSSNRHYWVGEYDRAMALAQEALHISQSIGNAWGQAYSLSMIGSLHLERGEVEAGIQAMEQAIALAEQANYWGSQVYDRAFLALVYGLLGDLPRAFEIAHLALAKTEEFNQPHQPVLVVLALLHLYSDNRDEVAAALDQVGQAKLGGAPDAYPESALLFDLIDCEVALARHEYERVLHVADRVIASMHANKMRPMLPNMLYLRSRALLGLGRIAEAGRALAEARTELEALGTPHSLLLLPVVYALDEIEARAGDHAEVRALRQKARDLVDYLSAHIHAPDLRARFLALPAVQTVMRQPNA